MWKDIAKEYVDGEPFQLSTITTFRYSISMNASIVPQIDEAGNVSFKCEKGVRIEQ